MDTIGAWVTRFEAFVGQYATHADAVLRVGLGVLILLAGAHKLVAPGVWAAYTPPPVEALWPVALDPTMVLFGVSEVLFGLVLIVGAYTTVFAALTAVSLLGTVLVLAVGAVQTGRHVDVLIRDVGLTVLALGVTLRSAAPDGASG